MQGYYIMPCVVATASLSSLEEAKASCVPVTQVASLNKPNIVLCAWLWVYFFLQGKITKTRLPASKSVMKAPPQVVVPHAMPLTHTHTQYNFLRRFLTFD